MNIKGSILFLLILALPFFSKAQTTVQVLEEGTGQPLPHAHVTWWSENGKEKTTLMTDQEGRVSVTGLHKGVIGFRLKVSYIGFQTFDEVVSWKPNIQVFLKPDQQSVGEVVVTAQYAPGHPEKAVHKIRVIGLEKIQNMAAISLGDVLANEANIRLSWDRILGSSMSLQGIGGENVKILVDGIPVIGRLDGNIDLSQINLHDIQQVEIVEGPMSVNYGTNALAGTINLITKKNRQEKAGFALTAYHESPGTWDGHVSGFFRLKKTGINISGGRNYFDGWSPGDSDWPGFSKTLADSSRYKLWKPREQYFGRLQVLRPIGKLQVGIRSDWFGELITNRGYPIAPYQEKAFDDFYRTFRMDHALFAEGTITDYNRINAIFSHDYYRRIKNTYRKDLTNLKEILTQNPGDQDTASYQQWMSRTSWTTFYPDRRINFELGYDLSMEQAEGSRILESRQEMGDYSLFTSAEMNLGSIAVLRPGIRLTHNTLYTAPLTPSVHLKLSPGEVSIRLMYGRGFRAPSIKELYFSFVDINHNIIGNTGLKAENSHNFSGFFTWKKLLNQRIFQVDASLFYNRMGNMIRLAQLTGGDANSYSYTNIGKYQTQGASLGFTLMFQHLKANSVWTVTGSRIPSAGEELEKSSQYAHEIKGSLSYSWKRPGISLNYFHKYQGKVPGFTINSDNETTQTFIDPFHMAEISLKKQWFNDRLAVVGGIKNLFGVKDVKAMMAGGIHSGGETSTPIGMGRIFFLKLDYHFTKR